MIYYLTFVRIVHCILCKTISIKAILPWFLGLQGSTVVEVVVFVLGFGIFHLLCFNSVICARCG